MSLGTAPLCVPEKVKDLLTALLATLSNFFLDLISRSKSYMQYGRYPPTKQHWLLPRVCLHSARRQIIPGDLSATRLCAFLILAFNLPRSGDAPAVAEATQIMAS